MKRGLAVGITLGVIGGAILIPWMRDGSSEGNGEPMISVQVPILSTEAKLGKQSFEQNCISCHAQNAEGRGGVGPPLVHKIYEPSHHSDQAFYLAAKRGVRSHHWSFGNMPPVEQVSNQDMKTIISYVRELQRANGIF